MCLAPRGPAATEAVVAGSPLYAHAVRAKHGPWRWVGGRGKNVRTRAADNSLTRPLLKAHPSAVPPRRWIFHEASMSPRRHPPPPPRASRERRSLAAGTPARWSKQWRATRGARAHGERTALRSRSRCDCALEARTAPIGSLVRAPLLALKTATSARPYKRPDRHFLSPSPPNGPKNGPSRARCVHAALMDATGWRSDKAAAYHHRSYGRQGGLITWAVFNRSRHARGTLKAAL